MKNTSIDLQTLEKKIIDILNQCTGELVINEVANTIGKELGFVLENDWVTDGYLYNELLELVFTLHNKLYPKSPFDQIEVTLKGDGIKYTFYVQDKNKLTSREVLFICAEMRVEAIFIEGKLYKL